MTARTIVPPRAGSSNGSRCGARARATGAARQQRRADRAGSAPSSLAISSSTARRPISSRGQGDRRHRGASDRQLVGRERDHRDVAGHARGRAARSASSSGAQRGLVVDDERRWRAGRGGEQRRDAAAGVAVAAVVARREARAAAARAREAGQRAVREARAAPVDLGRLADQRRRSRWPSVGEVLDAQRAPAAAKSRSTHVRPAVGLAARRSAPPGRPSSRSTGIALVAQLDVHQHEAVDERAARDAPHALGPLVAR